MGADGIALQNTRTDRVEPATTVRIVDNGFETYEAGSRYYKCIFTWSWFNR